MIAELAGVKHFLLALHDPQHTNAHLNQLFYELKSGYNYPFKYDITAEAMNTELPLFFHINKN